MKRISFLQGMLVGFVFIVALLGGVAVHGWLLLEKMVVQNRDNTAQALALTAAVQILEQRSVDLERSARQYLVLGDADLRERFREHLDESLQQLSDIEKLAGEALGDVPREWRLVAASVNLKLTRQGERTEHDIAGMLDHLGGLNNQIAEAGKRWIEQRNALLLDELERHRLQLGAKLILSMLGAVFVALAMGWWLLRPVRQLDRAIRRLGARRFGDPVVVDGPVDLRRLGRRLDWLRQHLSELESDRQQTLRHVSHELKTPLTALKEGVALLDEEVPGPLSPGQREVVSILTQNVRGLQGRIESLLGLNAAAFDARQLNLGPVEPALLLADAAQRHALAAQARTLEIVCRADPGVARLDADKMALILDNLLANAIDFSPQGGKIELQAARLQHAWRFDCIDQGCGVAEEDADRIFEPFVQGRLRAPVDRRGSGVGLSIVRELAGAMSGSVRLLNRGQGAHFCVEIPDEQ